MSESKSETYEVGELVQISDGDGQWRDAIVAGVNENWMKSVLPGCYRIDDPNCEGSYVDRIPASGRIRKHPSRGWKVGDECEVRWAGSEWQPAVVNRTPQLRVELRAPAPLAGAYFDPGPGEIRRHLPSAPAELTPAELLEAPPRISLERLYPMTSPYLQTIRNATAPAKNRRAAASWLQVNGFDKHPLFMDAAAIEDARHARDPDPLDAVIDGWTLRKLLEVDSEARRIGLALLGHATPAQLAAVSAYRSAELRTRIAAGPSQDAERWREEQRMERGPRVTYSEED